jgi:hypothetical protein
MENPQELYVQYGCGLSCPEGWLNYDSSPSVFLERLPAIGQWIKINQTRFPPGVRYGDILHGLPVANGAVNGIFASHVLEHMSYDDFWIALQNTYKLLVSGGIFRLVLPDLRTRAEYYCAQVQLGVTGANSDFMRSSYLGIQRRPKGAIGILRSYYGNSAHLWMWDVPSIMAALNSVGFKKIRPAAFNDCEDRMFRRVEDEGRFFWVPSDEAHQRFPECAVEARRP